MFASPAVPTLGVSLFPDGTESGHEFLEISSLTPLAFHTVQSPEDNVFIHYLTLAALKFKYGHGTSLVFYYAITG